MRPHRIVSFRSWLLSAALAVSVSQTPACSSHDTVLALTINSNQADVGGPAKLRVTVTPPSGLGMTETFAPELVDGTIVMSFFRRITLNGLSGKVSVTVDALNGSDTVYLSATTTADLIENGAVAARVELETPVTPQPDGGTSSAGGHAGAGTGTGGAGGGAGGAAGGDSGSGNPAGNLITNGDFSGGMANWHVDSGNGNINNGRLCLMGPSGSTLLGWMSSGGNVTLDGSKMYRLSYSASATSSNVRLHVKVALSVQPYTSDYEVDDTLNNNAKTFMHTFMPMNGTDTNMGIAITVPNGTNGTVCIDDVSLVPL